MRALLLAVFAVAFAAHGADRPHVYLVVVDGLDARLATPERMPRLAELAAREPATSRLTARAAMPTRTNPNHVTLATGVEPAAHGITGNAWWSRRPSAKVEKLDDPGAIEVETFFTRAPRAVPPVATAAAVGKPKLARLFAAVPGRQRAPDVVWSPDDEAPSARDPATGYATDADTMAGLVAATQSAEPDFALVNLADVDRNAHGRGPDSEACATAIAGADAAIARLVDALRTSGRWSRSVVVVTADHGFTSLAPRADRPYPVVPFGRELLRARIDGVHLVADGGVEHVYADGVTEDARDAGGAAATLARVAALARETPGVAEVLARVPVDGVPLLGTAHPDWHLDHPRTGDLLLVAAPGHQLVDPWDPVDAGLLGNHGGPDERSVPLVVTGGWPGLRKATADLPPPSAADVAATVAAWLGLPAPRRLDGAAVAPELVGRAIAALLAPGQSPH